MRQPLSLTFPKIVLPIDLLYTFFLGFSYKLPRTSAIIMQKGFFIRTSHSIDNPTLVWYNYFN